MRSLAVIVSAGVVLTAFFGGLTMALGVASIASLVPAFSR